MSERQLHLQRQRALLKEHLAWIDSEITRENQSSLNATAATDQSSITPSTALNPSPEPSCDADVFIEKYAAGERQNPADIRRGCLFISALAVILSIVGFTAVWLLFYR
jgi:hypothetical protein